MKVFYDKDCDLSLIKGKTVAILGYGSQGHAHAQNLNDSGVKVVVGLRKGGASWDKVGKAGLTVMEVNEAVKAADLVMILLPDENIPQVYSENVAPHIKQGGTLAFAHGFNIHYNQVVPRDDLDVIMVAPKGPGHTVRSEYLRGGGVPSLIAVHQDRSGKARDLALSYAVANGGGKGGKFFDQMRPVAGDGPARVVPKARHARAHNAARGQQRHEQAVGGQGKAVGVREYQGDGFCLRKWCRHEIFIETIAYNAS